MREPNRPRGTWCSWKKVRGLRSAAGARRALQGEGWTDCPTWRAVLEGQGAPAAGETSAGERPHGWQCHATRCYRDRVLLPALLPSARTLLRLKAGPQAGTWLIAIPAEAATTLPPQAMQVALRRRLRRRRAPHALGPQSDQVTDEATGTAPVFFGPHSWLRWQWTTTPSHAQKWAFAVQWLHAEGSRVGEPLLWHDLAFRPYRFSRHSDPGALHHRGTSCRQAWTSLCMARQLMVDGSPTTPYLLYP